MWTRGGFGASSDSCERGPSLDVPASVDAVFGRARASRSTDPREWSSAPTTECASRATIPLPSRGRIGDETRRRRSTAPAHGPCPRGHHTRLPRPNGGPDRRRDADGKSKSDKPTSLLCCHYVAISRARDRAELVTDEAHRFADQSERATGERVAALDATPRRPCARWCSAAKAPTSGTAITLHARMCDGSGRRNRSPARSGARARVSDRSPAHRRRSGSGWWRPSVSGHPLARL